LDRDSLLPQPHPRYKEKQPITAVENSKKKNPSQMRSKDSRELWQRFYDKFKEVHDYQYVGDFMRDTGNIEKLLKKPGINREFIEQMIDYIFDEKRGYWGSSIVTVNTLCYNQSMNAIVDVIKQRERQPEDPNRKSKFGTL